MINTDKNIYIAETETKPNKYSILVLRLCVVGIAICWVMNEIGLFRCDKALMRAGSTISLLLVLVPLLFVSKNEKLLSNPRTKYWIITATTILTFNVSILLTFHTTIMLLMPISVAMLYRSKDLGKYACAASISATILSPIIGYILHTWDVPLFQELILIATDVYVDVINPTYTFQWLNIGKIILYIVFPRLIMVGSYSLLMFYVIGLGDEHVKNQILLNRVAHRDNLTGLYNQNYYKEVIDSKEFNGQVGVIFFDVNGLKEANDSKGHEYGDLLLSQCSKSILDIIDENRDYPFRIGGDEFVVIMENADEKYVISKLRKWQKALEDINNDNRKNFNGLECSMASGWIIGNGNDIYELVRQADANMYQNKVRMKNGSSI